MNEKTTQMSRVSLVFCYLGLLALTLTAFVPLWRNQFIEFDDGNYITRNPAVASGLTRDGFCWAFTTFHAGYWHPLTWLSLQCDAQFFSRHGPAGERILSPTAFHIINLLWHCGTVLMLFTALRIATGAVGISFVTAALFAVHPLRVESVAWAAERKDVLSMFFGVLTVWAYIRYARAPRPTRYLSVVAAFALGLLAKPMLVTLPIALLLLDYWPLRRFGTYDSEAEPGRFARASLPRLVLEKMPLLALAAGASILTVITQGRAGAISSLEAISGTDRLANVVLGYGWYLEKTFWPQGLALFYPREPWSLIAVMVALAVGSGITGLAIARRVRWPWLLVGWLWFLGTLLPVSGLVQAGDQARADRFSYLPHVGLLLAFVMLANYVLDWLRWPPLARGLLAAVAIALVSLGTWVQTGYWRDDPTIWEHTIKVTPPNAQANSSLAFYHWHQMQLAKARGHAAEAVRIRPETPGYRFIYGAVLLDSGMLPEAADQLEECVRQKPGYAEAWELLGTARLRQGHWQPAIVCFNRVLELQPESAVALARLGMATWRAGEPDLAVEHFAKALKLNPNQAEACNGMGLARLRAGDNVQAAEYFRRALQGDPYSADAHSNLGVALGRQGLWNEAISAQQTGVQIQIQYEQFLREQEGVVNQEGLVPDLVTYRCRLAYALFATDRKGSAYQEYKEALRRWPNWPKEFTARAWKLATSPNAKQRDPALACELAGESCQALEEPSAEMLDVLAAAYAAAGRYGDAVRTAQQAKQKASAVKASALVQEIEARSELYKQGKPFVEAADR